MKTILPLILSCVFLILSYDTPYVDYAGGLAATAILWAIFDVFKGLDK